MGSNGNSRSGLPTAGGVFSIMGGTLEIIVGGIVVAIIMHNIIRGPLVPLPPIPWIPGGVLGIINLPPLLISVGIALIVLGVIAIVGGISALKRQNWGMSLTGAICALPSIILGILAVIFVSVSKKEFEI